MSANTSVHSKNSMIDNSFSNAVNCSERTPREAILNKSNSKGSLNQQMRPSYKGDNREDQMVNVQAVYSDENAHQITKNKIAAMNFTKSQIKGFSYSKSVGRDIKETVDEHEEEEESPLKEPSESTLNN